MHSTMDPKQTDPFNVLVARADEELAHAYERITRAAEEAVRAEEQLSKLERDAARHSSDHPQTRMNTLRPAVPGNRPSLGGRAVRAFTGLILAACIGVAAIAWQSPHGDAAKQIIARWAPQLVLTSSLPLENPGPPAQPSPATAQAAAAKAAPTQPVAQTAPEDVAPTVALSPELAQLLQTMARDLATVGHEIEQLKINQEQMARDNAKAAEQLKASQEQTARSEQGLRSKISGPPPRLTATPTRKPVPTL
jgi:pyruvate/2-oxoglutarate dehydrogenase complex dihydrolipoamide acyltransferase (E2) component